MVAQRRQCIDVRPYLPHAVAATLSVVVLPFVIALSVYVSLPGVSVLLAVVLGVALAVSIAVTGTAIWRRKPESADLCFGELMIWGWIQRRRAEEKLAHGAHLLGLDHSGQPAEEIRIPRRQQVEVLHDLTAALEAKDPYTHGHSRRVQRHVYLTAAVMGLSREDIDDLTRAAVLHDVGKIRVPDRVLRKPGELTIEERVLVQEHVLVGAWMVSGVGGAGVVSAVRHHHERWDGKGYPDGLCGKSIPLLARIIAVADAYDAMTSTRPYRPAAEREDAVKMLREGAGVQFDPYVVEAFVSTLPARAAVGAFVLLVAGPRRLARELAVWFKRTGAHRVAPGAGATAAAVLLSAFMLTPHPGRAGKDPAHAAPSVLGNRFTRSAGAASAADAMSSSGRRRDATAARVMAAAAELASHKGQTARGDGGTTTSSGSGGATDRGERGGRGAHKPPTGRSDRPSPTRDHDRGGSGARPDKGHRRDRGDKTVPSDPQPLRGRDCAGHPARGTGPGQRKHCRG